MPNDMDSVLHTRGSNGNWRDRKADWRCYFLATVVGQPEFFKVPHPKLDAFALAPASSSLMVISASILYFRARSMRWHPVYFITQTSWLSVTDLPLSQALARF